MFLSGKRNEKTASDNEDGKGNSIVRLDCGPAVPLRSPDNGSLGSRTPVTARHFRTNLASTGNTAQSAIGVLMRWGVGADVLTMRPTVVA